MAKASSESRSKFKEELERYRSLVTSESIPALERPQESISSHSLKSLERSKGTASVSELSKPPQVLTSSNHSQNHWYQRYPASVVERLGRSSSTYSPTPEERQLPKRPPSRDRSSHNDSRVSKGRDSNPDKDAEVAKWKEFGTLMAESYQELKKKYESVMGERSKEKMIISRQKDQIKKLKALLAHSQGEVEKLRSENQELSSRPSPPLESKDKEDHHYLTQMADQLISLRTDLDKRTQPKLVLEDLEDRLSPRSRKLSLDLDLPLGGKGSRSVPKLR